MGPLADASGPLRPRDVKACESNGGAGQVKGSSHRFLREMRTVSIERIRGVSSMDASWIERHGVSPVELARCVGACSHARSTPDPLPPTKHTPLISPTRPPEKFRRGVKATRPVSAVPKARRVLGLVIKRGIYSLALVNSQVDHPAPSPSPPALACWTCRFWKEQT